MNRSTVFSSLVVFSFLLAACGGNTGGGNIDAAGGVIDAPAPDADDSLCGDGVTEGVEQCDDANMSDDDLCLSDCTFACGDGVVNAIESCDTAIAAGDTGACPSSCDDADSCTSDQLSGTECSAICINAPITVAADNDGCCPNGEDANTDNDCAAVCGNTIIEPGETCDTGNAGQCPALADCNDGQACTDDTLQGANCTAVCQNAAITAFVDNDGCCPPNGTPGNDNDCTGVCGDGTLDSGETCDTAIAANDPGACPTSCNDNDSCTTDTLLNGGSCAALCTNVAITTPIDSDGCCPSGANANSDNDCTPVCGNGVTEAGEQCDDGGTANGDGCDSTCQNETTQVTAYRLNNLYLRDPHIYVDLGFLGGCSDANESVLFQPGVNPQLNDNISNDGDMDGLLDLSVAVVFRPLAQGASTSPVEIRFPDCSTAPIECTDPETTTPVLTTANNGATQCLQAIPGTVFPYNPPVAPTPGPCFVTDLETLTLNVAGITITLSDAQVSGTYNGNPASSLSNGIIMGFVSEADAEATMLSLPMPIGNTTLAALLPGGTGACNAGHDDRDMNNGVSGWWLYFNYLQADSVTWIAP